MRAGTVCFGPFLSFFGVVFLLATLLPAVAVPSFDGKEESFPGYAMEVEKSRETTNLDVGKRASSSILQMESTARDVRMAMGSDELMAPDAVGRFLKVLLDYLTPHATW